MKTLKFLSILLALSVCFVPGDAAANPPPFGDPIKDDGYNGESKEVSFTEYSLASPSCQWTEINNNNDAVNEIVVINSNEETYEHVFKRY